MKISKIYPLILILIACNNNNNNYYCPPDTDPLGNKPYGGILTIDGCKSNIGSIQTFCDDSKEGLSFTYFPNEKILYLKHINSGFNCEPGKISAKINISNTTITIEEIQESPSAYCNCLFDISYDFRHIENKTYLVSITNPIIKGTENQQLSFYIDLTQKTQGEFTLFRGFYPWAE